jgi:hypothetical protein
MAVVERIARLAQRAEQITGEKRHGKQQDAFVQPAGHAPAQCRGQERRAGRVGHGIACGSG